VASTGPTSLHDYLYEVDRIGKSITGEVQLELTHFPVDASLASVVAQEVAAAVGSGLLLPTGLTGVTCDVNSSGDTSVPEETFTDDFFPDYGSDFDSIEESELDDPPVDNPDDGLNNQIPDPSASLTSNGDIANPEVGDTLTAPAICEGGRVTFYRNDPSAPSGRVIVAQATSTYTMVINDINYSVYAEIECPEPSSPTGYGEPIPTAATPTIAPNSPKPGLETVAASGSYSPTGATTVSRTAQVTEAYKLASGCAAATTTTTGTLPVVVGTFYGIQGMRMIRFGQVVCGLNSGYSIELLSRGSSPSGTVAWRGLRTQAGSSTVGFGNVSTTFSFSTTALDATSANNLRFD
jgi:hypothetical protein